MTKNKGVALILSVIILTAVLAIALTAGKVMVDKIKMSRNTSDSMKAYYAAESGIEYALYRIKNSLEIEESHKCDNWQPVDGAFYCLKQEGDSIKAIGKAGEARRGIEVEVAQAAGPTGPSFYWTEDDTFDGSTAGADDVCATGYHMCTEFEWVTREYATGISGGTSVIFESLTVSVGRTAWFEVGNFNNCNGWSSTSSSEYGAIYRLCSGSLCTNIDESPLSTVFAADDSTYRCDTKHRVICCSD
ncbi:MAG: pilus assembly PilX N-terminal domain-containing protein [bacterium]